MEKERVNVNSDKVKKLQETIKKLELQNEQLKAQQLARNGLLVTQVCDNSVSTDSNRAVDDGDIIPLNEKDLSDDQTWLYVPEKASECDARCDIGVWLRRRVEAISINLKNPRSVPLRRNLELDSGEKQSIDTRTFTRPKKRFGISSTASSLSFPGNAKRIEEKDMGRRNDDLSAMLQSAGLPLKGVLDSILQKHRKTNVVGVEAVIQSEENMLNENSPNNKLDSTYMVHEDDEPDIVLSARRVLGMRESSLPRRSLGSAGVKGSCPALDQTFQVVNSSPQLLIRGKRETGSTSILDCTFTLAKGNSPHSEEDCLSTTSDGSLSSSSRPMNADDVQQIARLQEESLKQSTPVRRKKSIMEITGDDMPSPILQGSGSDDNHGYHSDRSSPIGSLTDGGRGANACCSRASSLTGGDSLHSSPMTSPHASMQALHQIPVQNGLQDRDNQGHPLKSNPRTQSGDNIHDNHEEESTSAHPKEATTVPDGVPVVPNASSGVCKLPPGVGPPPVRAQADPVGPATRSGPSKGVARPQSGIPRPQSRFQSRIPAPTNSRIPSSKPVLKKPPKVDWMDGCY
ncbi:uncharacterized protein [Hetaerina americana]|uniref:uncharacterized protein isoform X4 n=1 Tax=Hetaerina americana TaxID=62018 RepID=UPI003A7F115F